MSTRVVTILGMGPGRDVPHYLPVRYRDEASALLSDSESPLSLPLHLELAGPGACLRIVGTKEVRERWISSGLLDSLVPGLPQDCFVEVPSGEDPGDAAAFVALIQPLLSREALPEERADPERVVVDLTHGFRAQSLLATAAIEAVIDADLRRGRAPNLQVVYTAFEARRDGIAPIWDLTGLLSQHAWTSAIHAFRSYGRADALANLCEAMALRIIAPDHADLERRSDRDRVRKLGRSAKALADSLATLRLETLVVVAAPTFRRHLDEAMPLLRAQAPSVEAPLAELADWADGISTESMLSEPGLAAVAGVARLAYQMERFAEAASPDLGRLMVLAEKVLITWSLNQERGVKLRAAKALGINRVTLDRKLAEYDLNVQRGRGVIEVA